MSDTNPLFEALTSNIVDHDAKRREAREEHSMIMDSIADREGVDTSTLSGKTYFDPTIMGFRDYDYEDDFDEAAEADWNLSVRDMPVGLTGMKNRKRPLDIARATAGMATALDSLENRQLIDSIGTRAREDYSGSGINQFGRSIAGILPGDFTGDTNQLLNELREGLGTTVLKDDDGNPIDFTPEAYLKAVTKYNPEISIALRRYDITPDSLKGIDNVATATEELAKKLWYAGQEERSATSKVPNGFFTLRGLNNLANTLGQDPDLAAEIGIEVAGTVVTGGGYLAAKLATKSALAVARRSGGAAAKAAAKAAARGATPQAAARYGRMAARGNVRRAEALSDAAMRGADAIATANVFKPGLSMGGNVFEWAARRGAFKGKISQNAAFATGQLVDGFVGGAGARLRSNMYLQDEAMNAYGDLQGVELTDNAAIEGLMGSGFSLVLGSVFRYGGRAFINQFRTESKTIGYDDFATENARKARTEQEQLEAIYGEDIPAGVKAWQAQRNSRNEAMMQLSFLGGEDVDLTGVTALMGNLPNGISSTQLNIALQRLTRSNVGFLQDGHKLDNRAIAAALLDDKEFLAALESHKSLSPEEVRTQAKLRRAQILDGTDEDLELTALLGEGVPRDEAIAKLKAQRLAEIEAEKQAEADALAAARADAKRRKDTARKSAEAEEATRAQEAAELEAAQRAADDANAEAATARQELDELTNPDAPEAASTTPEAIEVARTKVAEAGKKADEADAKVKETSESQQEARRERRKTQKDTDENVDKEMAKRQEQHDRKVEALDAWKSQVESDVDGAGGGNKTDLVHLKAIKQADVDERKAYLDRELADMEQAVNDGEALDGVSGDYLHRRGLADEDTNAHAMYSLDEVRDMVNRRKEELDEVVDKITDEEIITLSRIINDDEMAAVEVSREAQLADDAATHQLLLSRSNGDIIDDPSKFRAPRVRTDEDADARTVAARKAAREGAEDTADLEKKAEDLSRRAANSQGKIAEAREADRASKDQPSRAPSEEELEALIDQTAANLENFDMKKLKAEATEMKLKGRSKYKTLADRPALARALAEEKVGLELDKQLDAAEARKADDTLDAEVREEALARAKARAEKLDSQIDEAFEGLGDGPKAANKLNAIVGRISKLIGDARALDSVRDDIAIGKLSGDDAKVAVKEAAAKAIADQELEARRVGSKEAAARAEVRKLEEELLKVRRELNSRGKYDRRADLDAARIAEARLASLLDRASMGTARRGDGSLDAQSIEVGTASYDAVHSAFKGTSLEDIDLEYAFGEAIVRGSKPEDMLFNLSRVQELLQSRIDALDRTDVDPDAKLTPQQLRQRQANEVAEWRKAQAGRQASALEASTGSKFRGAKDVADYELQVIKELTRIMRNRKQNALDTTSDQTVRAGITGPDGIGRFISEGFEIAHLGDGTLDHVHPTVAARAMADMLSNNTNGTQMHKADVTVRNEETGLDEVRFDQTDSPKWISGIQPGSDREIAMVLQKMEYDYRMEAIAKHDFDRSDSPSIEEVLDFLEGKNMLQDQGRAMNREELALRALWTPPQLRTDIVNGKPETLRERIARVKRELLDMDAVAYDLLHDEFSTRGGDWGVGQVAEGTENGNWFASHGVAGGFPLATVMPKEDGSYSFGQAVLDAHTLVHPQTMDETLGAIGRGNKQFERMQELKKKKNRTEAEESEYRNLRSDKTLRSLDGAQNGVRHAHALAMLDDPDTIAKVYDLVGRGTGTQRDFYNDLATASSVRLSRLAEGGGDSARLAKIWMDSGAFRFDGDGIPTKASRKFAKKPVMILPYGAGKTSIRGAIEDFLKNTPEGQEAARSMGNDRNAAVEFLTEQWYGNNSKDQRKAVDSLIREALELPEAEEMMGIIRKDIQRKDPMAKILDAENPTKAAELMIEEAQRMAKNNEFLDEDSALRAIQLEARARAITQADNLTPEQIAAHRKAIRTKWTDEVNLLHSGDRKAIVAKAQAGEMTFFESSINALLRQEYKLGDTAQARNSAAMTGQTNADFGLPKEAQGGIYFQQLVDWRTRMVTPTTREADLKGRKSRRGMLDVHGVMEEAEFVTFKTDEAEAKADIRNIGETIDGKEFTEDDWFAKHIDQTVGSGVFTYSTHKGSLKQRLKVRADSLGGEKLRAKARELAVAENKAIETMPEAELKSKIYDAMVKAEEDRIEALTVKAALAEAAPEFSPPLRKEVPVDADDSGVRQLPRLSEAQKMDRWEAYSDDIRRSSKDAQNAYNALNDEGKVAYEKSYGKTHQSYTREDGSSDIESREMGDDAFKELPDDKKKQTPRTMGGMLGSRPIHPTESTDMMLGVPALRAAAQRRLGGKTAAEEGGKSVSKAARKAGQREMLHPHAVRRIENGGELFSTRERHRVTHASQNDLADVSLSEEHIFGGMANRYSPEVQDRMIERMLTDHAKRYGLDEELKAGKWGDIYAHRVWTKNIKQLKGDLDEVGKMEPYVNKRTGEVESPEDFMERRHQAIAAFHEKWRKIAEEDLKKWEDSTNKQWDAHDVDPFGNIREVSAFDDAGNHLTWREAIADSATRNGRGGRISEAQARRQTNIDAVTTDSIDGLRFTGDDSHLPPEIEWRRESIDPSSTLPIARADGPTDAPRQGFARTMVEDYQSGQMVDMDSLDDNQIVQVHYVHAMDRTSATATVGLHIGASLVSGMHRVESYTVPELRAALKHGKLNGAGANVRFTIADVEVVDGHMVGHNVRKSNSRNENFHILQNSQNRYIGDRLGVSALVGSPVRKQPSVWSRMDDRARATRHETSALTNESRGMIRFLSDRDSTAVDQSSFLGGVIDVGRYWNNADWRKKFFRSHLAETEANARASLGDKAANVGLKDINNELNINERGNLEKAISQGRNPEGLSASQITALGRSQTRTDGRGTIQNGKPKNGTLEGMGAKHPTVKEFLDAIEPENGRLYTPRQVRSLIEELDMESAAFDPTADPRTSPEMQDLYDSGRSVDEGDGVESLRQRQELVDLVDELAGAQLLIGGQNLLNVNTMEALMPGIEVKLGALGVPPERVLAAANRIVEHNRGLRKMQQLATWDGITGLGWTDVTLRAYSEGKIDLDNPSDADLQIVYEYWTRHEYGSGSRNENVAKMSDGDKKLARQAIAEAKRVTEHETPDPFSDAGSPTWKGSFVDQNGVVRKPEYFMEEKNFAVLSDGHRQFNDFLNSLLAKDEAGDSTLTLPEVRMLRAAAAQMDGDIFDGLDMKQTATLADAAKALGLPDPKSVRARGLAFNTKGQMGLRVLKNQLGRDLSAVDVVLHEVGHVAQRRLMAENSPEIRAARSMATNPEGKVAMRDMVTTMYGGKFTTEARKAYDYYTAPGNEDEFLAAWFSYTMMARSLDDRATINAAYSKAGGIGEVIARAIQKLASYAYRRVAQMGRIFGNLDNAYKAQMDRLMDVFTGKTEMPKVDRPDDFGAFHAEGGKRPDSEPEAWATYIEDLRRGGVDELDPEMVAAKAAYEDAVSGALDSAKPSDFDPDFPGSSALRDFHATRVADEFTDDDGMVDFGKMVENDWQTAEQWMAIHFLPLLQEGRYSDIPQIKEEAAVKRHLSSDAKAGILSRTYWDNRILQQARAEHTVNSTVQLQVGDAQYSIMQLLSELIDNKSILTNGRLNGRPFLSLTSVSKALESDIIRPMAILDDELRAAVATSLGKKGARFSRALAAQSEPVQTRLQHLRRLAGSLALPKETNQYKAAVEEMKKLKDQSPEEARITKEMADLHMQSAQRVKRDAVDTALVGQSRAEESGDMPLRLRREHMANKAAPGGYGEKVTDIYSKSMLADADNTDVDTLIGTGVLPDPRKVRTARELYDKMIERVDEGLLDRAVVGRLYYAGQLETVLRLMKSDNPEVLRKGFSKMITPEGRRAYEAGVKDGAWTNEGRAYVMSRFDKDIQKTESAANKVVYQVKSSGAELRALRLGRKVGSTSYFFGSDDFVSLPKLIDEAVDADGVSMFETDVRVGASALVRGIGLEAADSANLKKAFGSTVRGFSTKRLLQLLKKSSLRTDDGTKKSMEHGIRHLERAYEKLAGGLPSVDQTGGVITDGLARSATDFAMLTYGGNLGVAMLAETTATAINDVAPRFFSTPVKTMGMVWKSMTEGVSPIRKTQIARQLLFGMHVARDTVSARSIIRDTVDDLNPVDDLHWTQNWLKVGGSLTSKASMAPTVQTFNKTFAAAGAMDDVLTHLNSARRLRELMDERGGVKSKKEFKELARESGFGRKWALALRMQDAGLLEPKTLDRIEIEAQAQGADVSRIFDYDRMGRDPANADAVTAMRVFTEEAISENNVEPRVLDMRLVDNSGWNKIQDVFLAWPRAFYAQKSFVRPGNAFAGNVGHVAGFYLGQAMWDSMYTTLQELARGEDPDKIMHEVENDPAGWFAKKVTRMPTFGAWGSVLSEMAVDYARNKAAQSGVEGFGYHTRKQGGLDFGSSPVGSAMNNIATALTTTASYVDGLAGGTNTFSMEDRQAMQTMGGWSKMLPVANSLPAQVIKTMLQPTSPRDMLKNEMYYEVLQMKRSLAHERKKLEASFR